VIVYLQASLQVVVVEAADQIIDQVKMVVQAALVDVLGHLLVGYPADQVIHLLSHLAKATTVG
jgi:hypothetical protein